MEEVWKDINLTSSPMDALHNSTALRGIMFQDFLAGPFEKDPPPPPLPPPQLPATMLTLNPGVEFNLFGSLSPSSRQSPAMLFSPRSADGAGMTAQKRCAAAEPDISGGSGDRRHKRMIKNRESAARSRARKQAYTTELELEVDQLTKENAKLREQQRQLSEAAAADRAHRSKRTLHRTSTAPF